MRKLLIALCFIPLLGIAQQNKPFEYSEGMKVLYQTVFNGDTIPYLNLPEVEITGYQFASITEEYQYNKVKRKVEKVYPYFLIAKELMVELEEKEGELKKREFKKYKKNRKKELVKEFEKELRDLTTSEGKILVNMINRESGLPFMDLIKQYNSNFKAWIYNKVANKYGYDLEAPYDAEHPDNKHLEMALSSINASNANLKKEVKAF